MNQLQNTNHFYHFTEGDINTTPMRKKWMDESSNNELKVLLKRDADIFLHQSLSSPCMDVLKTAKAHQITSVSNHKYLDFHGNNVHQIGYGHEHVIQRVSSQMQTLPFSPRRFTNEIAIECAEKLTEIANMDRVLFAPGGTSVIGIALKLARIVTGKHKVVSLWDSFHGASMDAISIGGEACFRDGLGPLIPGVERIPPAVSYRGAFPHPPDSDVQYADYLDYVAEKEGGIGVFIAEAVRNTDVQVPSKAYWKRIREICDKHSIMLIIDDIPNGMGRSGHWFTHQAFDIEPDILCIGKGLGAGIIPIAAMLTHEKYNVAQSISLGHYTHEKSPLGCAAALGLIEVIENEYLLPKVQQDEKWMRDTLERLKQRYSIIGDVRGIGLLWGVELVQSHDHKERACSETEDLMYYCLSHGLSFKISQGNVLQLSPPLNIERGELSLAINILEVGLQYISQKYGYTFLE